MTALLRLCSDVTERCQVLVGSNLMPSSSFLSGRLGKQLVAEMMGGWCLGILTLCLIPAIALPQLGMYLLPALLS